MMILKHLTVEHFRLLREINLHFPPQGSILIQGPNEAGKSTLFESIYFALYGEMLTPDHGGGTIDNLVHYGAASATVTLTLSTGSKELTITRLIERGNGQKVTLHVRKQGIPVVSGHEAQSQGETTLPEEELITHLAAANERIIAELGHVDGEALRNSYFIEQKGLTRLENLHGREREATLRKLLGLEKLLTLAGRFKLTPHDEKLLKERKDRLQLAAIQARIPELSMQLGQLEAALDAGTVSEDLAEIDQQEVDIAEQERSLEQLQARRSELKALQSRVQQLKKADTTLDEIIASYDALAEARHELPEIERQIAALDRLEHEELPALEQRVHDLGDLARSFGTLERLSNDLLTAVNTIKALEKELKQQELIQADSKALDEQLIHAHLLVEHARQELNELEEHRRSLHPQLEARVHRLQGLSEKLTALQHVKEQHAQHLMDQGLAEENSAQLRKVQKDLLETEQELALDEDEAQRAQQQADALEQQWRQLSVYHQMEEWQRLKGLSRGLAEAEQQVRIAHQHQAKLTDAALEARQTVNKWLGVMVGCVTLALLSGIGAFLIFPLQPVVASGMGIVALLLLAAAGLCLQNYSKAHKQRQIADRQMEDAISQVSMMVAAREAAIRMGGSHDALERVEHEIRALGGTVPRSNDEAQRMLQQIQDQSESLPEIQRQVEEKRNSVLSARNQVDVTAAAVALLRKERTRLEAERKKEDWDNIEARLRADRKAIEDMQHEIASLAGQEGLPIPTFGASVIPSASTDSQLELLVAEAITATKQEIVALDGKLNLASDLARQVKLHQDAMDALLARQQEMAQQRERFQSHNLVQQIERAREQQVALRSALQSLQDSLRQRVKPLGVAFGQAAISNAEVAARKQLEALHITLGNKMELQSYRAKYTTILKERQDLLSDHYHQLAKFSGTLGSWIVPPNPFAEALAALRTRCQHELQEADERALLQGLEKLQIQENASKAKIALCQQEIEEAHDRIATLLAQRNRPTAKSYTTRDIIAVWPLVGEYSFKDRDRLEDEREALEDELHQLEQQELALSAYLGTGGQQLDLGQEQARMEQQERSYQTKKHGNLLVKAVIERLMRKMLPQTEYYMQYILSLLTSGRYQDVHLQTDEEEGTATGGAFQLGVWDSAAGDYVPKSALSGGAADQLSLALRLAFVIAALPRELSTVPGFVMLDEPFSSFDRERTQALVDVVTGKVLSQHFEQVLFIAHSSAFDPTMFPFHVYMESGSIVESNLPVLPAVQVMRSAENDGDDNSDGAVVRGVVPTSVVVESS